MKKALFIVGALAGVAVAIVLLVVLPNRGASRTTEIRVLTDRTESHLAPIFAAFEKSAHVQVKVVYLDKGLISRLESHPEEADVVITKDADQLEMAKTRGLLQPYSSTVIEQVVPEQFRDPDGTYFSDNYRARAIYYSKARVKPEELSTYEALADKKWKGRICIRSGYYDYNLSLFGQMVSTMGQARTRTFLEGLSANLARTPAGNDRDQVRAIYENKCDLAIANSYYMGIMLSSAEQKPWGESARVFFPDQSQGGTLVLRSALGLTKARANVESARKLLEYMVQEPVQNFMVNLTFAYPVNSKSPLPEINQHLGEGQPEVKQGVFKAQMVSPAEIVRHRETVIRMLDELQFDKPR